MNQLADSSSYLSQQMLETAAKLLLMTRIWIDHDIWVHFSTISKAMFALTSTLGKRIIAFTFFLNIPLHFKRYFFISSLRTKLLFWWSNSQILLKNSWDFWHIPCWQILRNVYRYPRFYIFWGLFRIRLLQADKVLVWIFTQYKTIFFLSLWHINITIVTLFFYNKHIAILIWTFSKTALYIVLYGIISSHAYFIYIFPNLKSHSHMFQPYISRAEHLLPTKMK